jgi:carboxyvinyl-carboxyphosphonate phosphorylmutase
VSFSAQQGKFSEQNKGAIMNFTERRERLREILAGDRCIIPAPVFDAVSARIGEDLGFEAALMTGPTTSAAVLGAPNHYLALLTATELAQQVRRVCRACAIPVVAVAEHGYGNALNVMRTVEELESAGVSALSIDDPALPFGFGSTEGKQQFALGSGWREGRKRWRLTPLEESVGKLKAAISAREDPSLVIIARTRAVHLPSGGLPETIRRVKAYERAGVDAIFLPAYTCEEVEAVHAETKLPLVLGGRIGEDERADEQFLAANGVRIKSATSCAFWASVKAVYDTLEALRDGKSAADLRPTLASAELQAQVTRQSRYNEWIKNFMT